MLKSAALIPSMLLLCACATTPPHRYTTSTSAQLFIPPNADRYHVSPQQKVVLGEAMRQDDPIYPSALIKASIPSRTVCLELEINEMGAVTHSRLLYDLEGCPTAATDVEAGFLDAAREAVRHWRFTPAILCTFPPPVEAALQGNNCLAEGAKVEALALKLAFRFTFSLRHGTTSVRSDELVP